MTTHELMVYEIRHLTTYTYNHEVSVSHHLARLTPRTTPTQRSLHHHLEVQPIPDTTAEHVDYFGNHVRFLTIETAHRQLLVKASHTVEVRPHDHPDPNSTMPWNHLREELRSPAPELLEAFEFTFDSQSVPRAEMFADYAAPLFPTNRPVLAAASDLMHRVHAEFTFDPHATTTSTPVADVLRLRRGVCQDFAHLMLACLRSLGLAARYVSGYLETMPPPGQPRLLGADASHAWISLFCPGSGWIDLDPTNDLLPTHRHITLAWGRDFEDVTPLRGVTVGAGTHTLSVAVDVVPHEFRAESESNSPNHE